MNPIQKEFDKLLSDPYKRLVYGGDFSVMDFLNIVAIVNNTPKDFIVYWGGNSRIFEIGFDQNWSDANGVVKTYKAKRVVEHLLKSDKDWIYCYQIDGVQTVLKPFIYESEMPLS